MFQTSIVPRGGCPTRVIKYLHSLLLYPSTPNNLKEITIRICCEAIPEAAERTVSYSHHSIMFGGVLLAIPSIIMDIDAHIKHTDSDKYQSLHPHIMVDGKFTLFPKLPYELRRKIWKLTFPGPPLIDPFSGCRLSWNKKGKHGQRDCRTSIALHVHHTSRDVALKQFTSFDLYTIDLGRYRFHPGSIVYVDLKVDQFAVRNYSHLEDDTIFDRDQTAWAKIRRIVIEAGGVLEKRIVAGV